ncbi:MAG: hypothetical protein Q4G34_09650 [Micrococcus sp.]|nr:hypothetical protein [Micrococcus sp.]
MPLSLFSPIEWGVIVIWVLGIVAGILAVRWEDESARRGWLTLAAAVGLPVIGTIVAVARAHMLYTQRED